MDDDETVARNRLLIYSGVRLGGLATFFLGMATMYTNLVREGGWPQVGAIIAILGAIDAVFAPRVLKKAWDQQDQSAGDRLRDGRSDDQRK
jgi:hypothetical protein